MERDPYASHLQVINAVLNTHKPKRVLEYGGGIHSTHHFLTRPHIERLVTVEIDSDWRDRLAEMYDDPRHTITDAADFTPSNFDLIFIDDGTGAAHRVQTIRSVLSCRHPIVVIHDAEVSEYATAIEEFSVDYIVYPTAPDTAVVFP